MSALSHKLNNSISSLIMFIDINANIKKVKPHTISPAAVTLTSPCAKDLFSDSYLDSFGSNLEDLIQSIKERKKAACLDALRITLRRKESKCETVYNAEALVMEVSKNVKVVIMDLHAQTEVIGNTKTHIETALQEVLQLGW
eukprot:TRINITY_DN2282_c0_g1_i5.p1 TRINITY_DN2282_c0_g1~~TRINITY_DN2282_c0_g1_i5.p1  ORF type:complete len:142 (+),score=22.17 TRINITY_DN2282_c0_g1_i5:405-830(+)